ncbi:MAG: energy transducer TonB [Acidobacteriota bacterium]
MSQATHSQVVARSFAHSFTRWLALALIGAALVFQSTMSLAQTRGKGSRKAPAKPAAKAPPKSEITEVPDRPPFRVDARIYQARPIQQDAAPMSEQVFGLTTANLVDEEKWLSGFAKVYPGFQFALVQSAQLRVFRTAKPARLVIGRSADRALELLAYGAHSLGDGKIPGTTLITELNFEFGKPEAIAISIQNMEVEEGKTYFFAVPKLRLSPPDYVKFLRPGQPVRAFEGKDTFLIVSLSVQLNPTATANRNLDETSAAEFQTKALKKVEPDIPEELSKRGLSGKVRVVIEVAPSGQVTHAYILSSSYPEMNEAAINAARQWQFSPTEFAQDPRAIASVLVFDFAKPTPK